MQKQDRSIRNENDIVINDLYLPASYCEFALKYKEAEGVCNVRLKDKLTASAAPGVRTRSNLAERKGTFETNKIIE